MTTPEFKEHLSIAGDPDSCMELMQDILAAIGARLNVNDIAQLENAQLVLKKIGTELKHWEKMQRRRQHPPRKDN